MYCQPICLLSLLTDTHQFLDPTFYHFYHCKKGIPYSQTLRLKVGLSPSKKNLCYWLHGKPFKNDEKCFLFHVKSSFPSQTSKFLS